MLSTSRAPRAMTALLRRARQLTLAASCCVALSACTVGGGSLSAENDALRRQNLDLKSRVEALEGSNRELTAKLSEQSAPGVSAEVQQALPRITGIEIEFLSGLTPADHALPATGAVVYLRPFDGLDRFTQAVGTLKLQVLALPQSLASAKPSLIAESTFPPLALRDAYRSGLTGTHYTFELPLSAPLNRAANDLLIRAEFSDAVTGQTLRAERIVKARA